MIIEFQVAKIELIIEINRFNITILIRGLNDGISRLMNLSAASCGASK
jgi:hypothetical protein